MFMAPVAEHDILCISLPLNNVTCCDVVLWLDSNIWRQFAILTRGNNDIADTTQCTFSYIFKTMAIVCLVIIHITYLTLII